MLDVGRKPLEPNEALERERVGATLRAIRKARDLGPDDLASKVGISRPYLQNIEGGRKPLTHQLLASICAALEIPPTAVVRADYFEGAA